MEDIFNDIDNNTITNNIKQPYNIIQYQNIMIIVIIALLGQKKVQFHMKKIVSGIGLKRIISTTVNCGMKKIKLVVFM